MNHLEKADKICKTLTYFQVLDLIYLFFLKEFFTLQKGQKSLFKACVDFNHKILFSLLFQAFDSIL